MAKKDFQKLLQSSPAVEASLHDLCRRRDFKKAVVLRLKREFPYNNPRKAFDDLCPPGADTMDVVTVAKIMREMDPEYTDEDT